MSKKAKTLPIQSVFIQKLKENLPPNVGLAEELAELLDVSIDSAYRRIRGETDLSIDEIYKITKKHNISIDSIFSNLGDSVTFTYTKLTDNAKNFEKYVQRVYGHVKTISEFDDKKVTYIAEEVPLFYSFFSDKLTQFKFFYWQRSVLNVPDFQGKKFEFGLIPEDQLSLAKSAFEEYKKIPSVEVWTNETILTIIKQVDFYVDSGVFKHKEDALQIVDEIREMVKYVQQCAETGRKEISNQTDNYWLYNSEVVLGTNCIYINTGPAKYAYITFNTFNSLTTNNVEFCDETDHWVKNIIKKSTLISGVAEKQRYQFFSKMYKNIDNCYERIKNL